MDWKTLGESLAKIGLPLLGAALPLPGGMALGTALASMIGTTSRTGDPSVNPADIMAKLTASSEAVEKAKEFELTHQETILKITVDAEIESRKSDSADMATVNATMQEETKNSANENWWQKGWRPFNGYVVGLSSFVSVVFVCVLFYQAITTPTLTNNIASVTAFIPQLAMAIATILAIPGAAVGITAWHRGMKQRMETQK